MSYLKILIAFFLFSTLKLMKQFTTKASIGRYKRNQARYVIF